MIAMKVERSGCRCAQGFVCALFARQQEVSTLVAEHDAFRCYLLDDRALTKACVFAVLGHIDKNKAIGRLSGMGDQAFVGSRAAEPLLAKIFNLSRIRRTDAPPAPEPWTVDDPIPFPEKNVLSIQRPESGSVYRRVGESFEIRPKANLGGELLWFLNGRPLCTEEARRTMVGSGSYELLCLSPTGEHALSRFRVY